MAVALIAQNLLENPRSQIAAIGARRVCHRVCDRFNVDGFAKLGARPTSFCGIGTLTYSGQGKEQQEDLGQRHYCKRSNYLMYIFLLRKKSVIHRDTGYCTVVEV